MTVYIKSLFKFLAYVDLNPVRAGGIVDRPEEEAGAAGDWTAGDDGRGPTAGDRRQGTG